VSDLAVAAGEITAAVQGSRATPYTVRVRVRAWSDDEWDRVLDALVGQIGHTAALLDGELPPEVADDVRRTGLDLLPGPGEVQPRCSCPDWADPCKHAAAVCYLVADQLDADPFTLLTLRGRPRATLLAALRARRGLGTSTAPSAGMLADDHEHTPDPGVVARDAWSSWTDRPADQRSRPPVLPRPPHVAGAPTVLGVDPPSETGIDPGALRQLAADAAARALALAAGAAGTGLQLDADQDLARRAAAVIVGVGHDSGASGATRVAGTGPVGVPRVAGTGPDGAVGGVAGAGPVGAAGGVGPSLDDLAARAQVPPRQLLRRALAWRAGGADALAVVDDQWDPGPAVLAVGRAMLGPGAVGRRNRVTLGDRQLRLGRDGRWYPYRRSGSGWDPDGPPVAEGVDGASPG
jgi:hypothetical protein